MWDVTFQNLASNELWYALVANPLCGNASFQTRFHSIQICAELYLTFFCFDGHIQMEVS